MQDGIDVLYDKLSAIKLDSRTQRQVIFFPQKLCLMVVWVVFVQPCQIDTVALCPQLFSFGRPPLRDKTGNIDSAEGIFLCEQPVIQESCDGMGVLTVLSARNIQRQSHRPAWEADVLPPARRHKAPFRCR